MTGALVLSAGVNAVLSLMWKPLQVKPLLLLIIRSVSPTADAG